MYFSDIIHIIAGGLLVFSVLSYFIFKKKALGLALFALAFAALTVKSSMRHEDALSLSINAIVTVVFAIMAFRAVRKK